MMFYRLCGIVQQSIDDIGGRLPDASARDQAIPQKILDVYALDEAIEF